MTSEVYELRREVEKWAGMYRVSNAENIALKAERDALQAKVKELEGKLHPRCHGHEVDDWYKEEGND